jgi:hypothetical protein
MTQYKNVAGTVSEGMESVGEQLEESGQPLAGKALKNRAVRSRVSSFVGKNPWTVAGLVVAGVCAYFYMREAD